MWVAGILVIGVGAGTAFAYFASNGSGTGYAAVTQTKPAVVEPATGATLTTTTKELSPGNAADLRLTLTNPNGYPVTVTGVTQDGTVTVVGGGSGCTATSAGVAVSAAAANLPSPIRLTPGAQTVTVPTGAAMTSTSSTTCQGASFQIPVDVTVHS